jgi:hypothetical protein
MVAARSSSTRRLAEIAEHQERLNLWMLVCFEVKDMSSDAILRGVQLLCHCDSPASVHFASFGLGSSRGFLSLELEQFQ